MLRRGSSIGLAIALLLAAALPVLSASGRQQQGRVRRLKACVGLLPTPGEPQSAAAPLNPFSPAIPDPDAIDPLRSPNPYPYVFWVLDQRKDLKPDGWEFFNPASPPFPTSRQLQRSSLLGSGLTAGMPLRPDMAAYWEVVLSPGNFDALAQMDVIYLPVARQRQGQIAPVMFTEEQRQLLQRLVDSGVTIWVDWSLNAPTISNVMGGGQTIGNPMTQTKNGFYTNLDFSSFTGNAMEPLDPLSGRRVGHPLLDGLFILGAGDGTRLGYEFGNPANAPDTNRAVLTQVPWMQANTNFAAVVRLRNGGAPVPPDQGAYVAAARSGAGFLVASAGNVAGAVGNMIPSTALRFTTQDLLRAQPEDLKFLYNMFAWRSEVSAEQKNGRHMGESGVSLNGLVERGTYPGLVPNGAVTNPWRTYPPAGTPSANLPTNPAAPLVINGVVVSAVRYLDAGGQVVTGVHAFEGNPSDDFDGNGFSDDGLRDATNPIDASTPATNPFVDNSIGQPYDRLMSINSQNAAGLFPPGTLVTGLAAGEVPDLAGGGNPQGAKSFVFGATSAGLFSLPAPRQGLPAVDFWQNAGVYKTAPNLGISYTGAPAFATVPGPRLPSGVSLVAGQLYAGGSYQGVFGSALNGKLVSFLVGSGGTMTPTWYYPSNNESNRMGLISGPITAAQIQDQGTGAIDTVIICTTLATTDTTPQQTGDTTGKLEMFVVATKGDPLTFPSGNTAPGATNPAGGRRFISSRLVNAIPAQGAAANLRENLWDPTRHYEVRVIDRATSYVIARFLPGQNGFAPLLDGQSGQVELPPPTGTLSAFQDPERPGVWDLNRFVLLADYAILPQQADQTGLTIRPRMSPATPYVRGTGSIQNQLQRTGIAGGASVGRDNRIYYATGQGYMCSVYTSRGRPQFGWKMRSLEYQDQTGLATNFNPGTPGNHLSDYAFVAAPAAGSRIVFSARGRGAAGTVYVMEPDAVIRFKLPIPAGLTAARAKDVMLEADHGLGINPNSPFLLSTEQPWGRYANQFSVEPDTATVTFQNMENFSLDLRQARSPQELLMIGVDTGGRPAVPIRWALRNPGMGEPSTQNPATAYIPVPISAIYRTSVAGQAESWHAGATIAGDRIYLMGGTGYLHELPIDPKSVNPSFPLPATGLDGFNIGNIALYGASALTRKRDIAADPPSGQVMANSTPAIVDGLLAVTSRRGLSFLGSPSIVIADSNRVVEASGDSFAVASLDVSQKHRLLTSEYPIPTDPVFSITGGAPVTTDRLALSRPAAVRKLDRNSSLTSIFWSSSTTEGPVDSMSGITETTALAEQSYLIADTGNNRCVEVNPTGKTVWELRDFQDPFKYLPAGEPLTLSGPMDVQRWIELERVPGSSPVSFVYVIHTLITDTGNSRILEIVDKVNYQGGFFSAASYPIGLPTFSGGVQVGADGSPVRWYHVLVWCSQTNAQGLRLNYRGAQRLFWPDANGNRIIIPPTPGIDAPIPDLALAAPPYLPRERYLSYTMAPVAGQTVVYPGAPILASYNQFFAGTNLNVTDRIPEVRPGGDSIVFLRGAYKLDEFTASGPEPVTLALQPRAFEMREPRPGSVAGGDRFRFTQGVIDPNVPILTDIHDEVGVAGSPRIVHRLSGVNSVQRTIRSDVRFAPEVNGAGVVSKAMYFLIADRDGVWEARMLPSQLIATPGQFRMTMAFTREDYARVSGGRRFTPASARRLQNGYVLIASRTPGNDLPPSGLTIPQQQALLGGDVFLLRVNDYLRAPERGGAPYDPTSPLHGWTTDLWIGATATGPSIRWRAASQLDPGQAPTLRTSLVGGGNPAELTNSYIPVQPNYADLVY